MTDTTPAHVHRPFETCDTCQGVDPARPALDVATPVDLDQIRARIARYDAATARQIPSAALLTQAAQLGDYARGLLPAMCAEIEQLRGDLVEMTAIRDHALRALHRDDYDTPINLRETIQEGLYGIAEWDGARAEAEEAPGWLIDAVMGAVHEHYARAVERADNAERERDRLREANTSLARETRSQRALDQLRRAWVRRMLARHKFDRECSLTRERQLEEVRDLLEQAGHGGAHCDDWPDVAPALRELIANRDEARARVAELETAHAEAEDNFRECRQIGRDAYLHAQNLGKVLAGITTTLNAIATRIATDSRDWSTQRTDAWLYALLVGWGDDALTEVAADHGWTYEQVARITILRSYVAALTEPAAAPAGTEETQ